MSKRYPFAIRVIGFSPVEEKVLESTFVGERGRGSHDYFCLSPSNLQDPDLYLVNGDDMKSLIAVSQSTPSEVRPVLLIGAPELQLPYPIVSRPIEWHRLFEALDALVEKRADTLSKLEASDIITVPERRRTERVDIDLTDPSDYQRMRRGPVSGGVLIVDKNKELRDYVAELLRRRNMPVEWAGDEACAADVCRRQKMSVVIINTSTPDVDPYRLCETVKEKDDAEKTAVIFLVGKSFEYDTEQGRRAGCEGFLNKPLSSKHLASTLKKFLS